MDYASRQYAYYDLNVVYTLFGIPVDSLVFPNS